MWHEDVPDPSHWRRTEIEVIWLLLSRVRMTRVLGCLDFEHTVRIASTKDVSTFVSGCAYD